MKVLITGCYGQVGSELMNLAKAYDCEAIGFDRDTLDISNQKSVQKMIEQHRPDAVINAAAYTAVDKAEEDIEIAFAVNRDGPANLALVCAQMDIPLIHYSTDYVFDGSQSGAYGEDDPVAPLGVYGESKLAGEKAVREGCSRHLILRTSWVFSAYGNNFVKTMLRLGAERDELGVVADQFGKPTAASEIARLTLEILPVSEDKCGVYHLAQPEAVSWYEFSQVIFDKARAQGMRLNVENVKMIGTVDYPTPAKRPANSVLNCERLESVFDVTIRPWRESLVEVVKELRNG